MQLSKGISHLPLAFLSIPVKIQQKMMGCFVIMPIYEYQCTACGHPLEVLQKMSEEPLKKCPECHKETLQKLVSAAGFQLKGTGWYATDFRNKPKTESASKLDSKSASGSSSGLDSKSIQSDSKTTGNTPPTTTNKES